MNPRSQRLANIDFTTAFIKNLITEGKRMPWKRLVFNIMEKTQTSKRTAGEYIFLALIRLDLKKEIFEK